MRACVCCMRYGLRSCGDRETGQLASAPPPRAGPARRRPRPIPQPRARELSSAGRRGAAGKCRAKPSCAFSPLSAVPLWGGVQSQTEDTLTAMGVVRCFKRHSLPGPPAQAGPVRCIILPYLRYYRTYAYTYNNYYMQRVVWYCLACRVPAAQRAVACLLWCSSILVF